MSSDVSIRVKELHKTFVSCVLRIRFKVIFFSHTLFFFRPHFSGFLEKAVFVKDTNKNRSRKKPALEHFCPDSRIKFVSFLSFFRSVREANQSECSKQSEWVAQKILSFNSIESFFRGRFFSFGLLLLPFARSMIRNYCTFNVLSFFSRKSVISTSISEVRKEEKHHSKKLLTLIFFHPQATNFTFLELPTNVGIYCK